MKAFALTILTTMSLAPGLVLANEAGLDPSIAALRPKTLDTESAKEVFRDMVVVQKRAMKKGGRFLMSVSASRDFSDGPYSIYSLQLNPGYALSDFWEIYATYSPPALNMSRSIVEELDNINLEFKMAKITTQYGLELLWAPAYGKDSVGARRVVRSDTFFKLGVHRMHFDTKDTGLHYQLAFGKTYFLGSSMGIRAVLSANRMNVLREIIREDETKKMTKEFLNTMFLEMGMVFYF